MFPEIMYGSGERMMPSHMVCRVVTLLLLSSIMSVSGLSDVGGDGHAYSGSLQPEAASSGVFIAPANLSEGDTLLDVSPNATGYLDGAVGISYDSFLDDGGQLKPASKVAALLGESGIDENDSLVITGECLPCGMGPSPAFFTYWLLKYLGHEKVKILQASADDLTMAGFNRSELPAFRPATEYAFHLEPDLLATYEFVAVGKAQIVDARPARDYEIGTIPGAINIPYEAFLDGDRLKPQEDYEALFSGLAKERPVVVFTNVGIEASVVWFALNQSGYDARLYSWRDWLENQPKFGYQLTDIQARPNPVRTGQTVSIIATFQETEQTVSASSSAKEASSKTTVDPIAEAASKLTIKGCATCGFGSPQGFANLDRKDGYVQIGTGVIAQNAGGTMSCTAVINGPDGNEVARTSLLKSSEGRYSGIWNANVVPGIYELSIVASASGNSENFADVLAIEVTE